MFHFWCSLLMISGRTAYFCLKIIYICGMKMFFVSSGRAGNVMTNWHRPGCLSWLHLEGSTEQFMGSCQSLLSQELTTGLKRWVALIASRLLRASPLYCKFILQGVSRNDTKQNMGSKIRVSLGVQEPRDWDGFLAVFYRAAQWSLTDSSVALFMPHTCSCLGNSN